MCFLWDFTWQLGYTLSLIALNETSACLHPMWSLEWNSNSIAGSQLASITTVKILQELWECYSPPVMSFPVLFRLRSHVDAALGFQLRVFNTPQRLQAVFFLKARRDPVTVELMFPGQLGGGACPETQDRWSVWL